MVGYAVGEVFKELSQRGDLPTVELARREYLYLPLIEDSVKGLAVHRLLAAEPTEYFGVLSSVYAGKSEQPIEDPSPEVRARARMSYRLLKSFHTLPGQEPDGQISLEKLKAWTYEVRRLAAESDRVEIADEFLGQLFAHSKPTPSSDDAWPPAAVGDLLDELSSDGIERAIEIERFNMRGAHWRNIDAGGAQERDLAQKYRDWASMTSSPRTSAMLQRIAEDWEAHAHRADINAEQEKLKR